MSKLILVPISDQSPCGIDTKYDEIYLQVEAEIDKINALTEGIIPNWRLVSDMSDLLLREQTKDIKLAVWWCYAQYELDPLNGLEHGLQILNELMESFKKNLFPLSDRIKFNALQWFETAIQSRIIQDRQLALPKEKTELYLSLIESFQRNVISLCEVENLLFKEVVKLLEIEKQKRAESVTKSNPSVPSLAQSADTITNDAEATKVLNQLKKQSELLSRYWRSKQSGDLRSIRLTRMISWLELEGLPQAVNGKTMINPPTIERIENIETLIQEGSIDHAIEMIETILLRSPFWLDGHFKLYQLLLENGEDDAASEIKNMLIGFLQSHQGISELQFKDGTPFAPSKCKQWLQTELTTEKNHVENGGEESGDTYETIKERCSEFLRKKEAKSAMEMLQRLYRNATTKEEQFKWRLLHAEMAIEAQKPNIAIALIEALDRDIERYRLAEWQPDLAAKVYRLLLSSFNRTQMDREKLEHAYQALCRLDSAEAFDIKF